MEIIKIETESLNQMVDITAEVKAAIRKTGIKDGAFMLFCPHTTAGLMINETYDPDVNSDIMGALENMVPKMNYAHAEGNSPAHIKAALIGESVVVPVVRGELAIGRWQGIVFTEFDGPRSRKVNIFKL